MMIFKRMIKKRILKIIKRMFHNYNLNKTSNKFWMMNQTKKKLFKIKK